MESRKKTKCVEESGSKADGDKGEDYDEDETTSASDDDLEMMEEVEDEVPGRVVLDTGEEEFQVERILKKRVVGGRTEYRIKWVGWDKSASTWEPAENLQNSTETLERFEKQSAAMKMRYRKAKLEILAKAAQQPEPSHLQEVTNKRSRKRKLSLVVEGAEGTRDPIETSGSLKAEALFTEEFKKVSTTKKLKKASAAAELKKVPATKVLKKVPLTKKMKKGPATKELKEVPVTKESIEVSGFREPVILGTSDSSRTARTEASQQATGTQDWNEEMEAMIVDYSPPTENVLQKPRVRVIEDLGDEEPAFVVCSIEIEGRLMYVVKMKGSSMPEGVADDIAVIPADKFSGNFPQLVISYYERNMKLPDSNVVTKGKRVMRKPYYLERHGVIINILIPTSEPTEANNPKRSDEVVGARITDVHKSGQSVL